jgi:hypothetical protein
MYARDQIRPADVMMARLAMTKRHWLDLRDSGIGKFVGKSSYDQLLEIMAVTGGLAKKAFSIYLHKSVPIKTCP